MNIFAVLIVAELKWELCFNGWG